MRHIAETARTVRRNAVTPGFADRLDLLHAQRADVDALPWKASSHTFRLGQLATGEGEFLGDQGGLETFGEQPAE